jgi:hypothetical protein
MHIYVDLRNDEVDQPIAEDELDESRTTTRGERQFPAREGQDYEIKDHRVYEADGKDLIVGIRDDAGIIDPGCLQKNAWNKQHEWRRVNMIHLCDHSSLSSTEILIFFSFF